MELKTIASIVLRRWYVFLPIALLALLFAASSAGSPVYTVEADFLLISPTDDSLEGTIENPVIGGIAVNTAADLTTVKMHSEQTRIDVYEAGYSDLYTFGVAERDPFVLLTVEAESPEQASESAIVLARLFASEMEQQQLRFGASSDSLGTAEFLEITNPLADYSAVRLNQALLVVAGIIVAFFAAVGVEGLAYLAGSRRDEFADMDKLEKDAARYGVGGESAAELTGRRDATDDREEEAPIPAPNGSRWKRNAPAESSSSEG